MDYQGQPARTSRRDARPRHHGGGRRARAHVRPGRRPPKRPSGRCCGLRAQRAVRPGVSPCRVRPGRLADAVRPVLCTLEASSHHLPHLERRRLADCCWAIGHPLVDAHSALGDARATAALLAAFMHPGIGLPPRTQDVELPGQAHGIVWPTARSDRPVAVPATGSAGPRLSLSDRARRNVAASSKPAGARRSRSLSLSNGSHCLTLSTRAHPQGHWRTWRS